MYGRKINFSLLCYLTWNQSSMYSLEINFSPFVLPYIKSKVVFMVEKSTFPLFCYITWNQKWYVWCRNQRSPFYVTVRLPSVGSKGWSVSCFSWVLLLHSKSRTDDAVCALVMPVSIHFAAVLLLSHASFLLLSFSSSLITPSSSPLPPPPPLLFQSDFQRDKNLFSQGRVHQIIKALITWGREV